MISFSIITQGILFGLTLSLMVGPAFFSLIQTSITQGFRSGSQLAMGVALSDVLSAEEYINPLPHALMLTAIVVSLGTTGVGLALLMRIKDKYNSMEEEDIIKKEDELV